MDSHLIFKTLVERGMEVRDWDDKPFHHILLKPNFIEETCKAVTEFYIYKDAKKVARINTKYNWIELYKPDNIFTTIPATTVPLDACTEDFLLDLHLLSKVEIKKFKKVEYKAKVDSQGWRHLELALAYFKSTKERPDIIDTLEDLFSRRF